jgi:predicted kinase
MIVNLMGSSASGKSSLAGWFVEKHPLWSLVQIDRIRRLVVNRPVKSNCDKPWPWYCEDLVWQEVDAIITPGKDYIFESTGIIYRLGKLFTSKREQGIYTIKICTPKEICKERSRARNRKGFGCYILDESYGIDIEWENIQKVPANLLVDAEDEGEELKQTYKEVEGYILKAKDYFDKAILTGSILGNNRL